MIDRKQWDVFVSHSSEDKQFVERLARQLRSMEIYVWYDEFVLRPGDSISASIDNGIANSRFGVAILSKSYFEKHWTQEEMAGMRAREPLFGKSIIPLWLKIEKEDVSRFSSVLADRLAIRTDGRNARSVAVQIAKVVKPDALNRWHTAQVEYKLKKGVVTMRDPRVLKKSPHRHRALNSHQLSRIRLLFAATADVFPSSLEEWIDNFRRDLHPDTEILWWETFVSAYLAMVNSSQQASNTKLKKQLFSAFFGAVNGYPEELATLLTGLPGRAGERIARIGKEFIEAGFSVRFDLPSNVRYRSDID
jgi:hypothetical protein